MGPIPNSPNSTTVKCEYRTGHCVQTENGAEKSLFLRCRGQTLSKLHKGVQSRKLLYLFWEAPDQGQKWILIRVQEVKDVSPQCKSVFIFFCFLLIFVPFLKVLHCWLCPILPKTLIQNRSALVLFNFRCPESVVLCKHLNRALYFLAFFLCSASRFFVLTSI